MREYRNNLFLVCLVIFLFSNINKLFSQCNNTSQWPTSIVSIMACGYNEIVNDILAGEYSLTSGYQHNATLIFSSSVSADYITIQRDGDNTVIAHGVTPLTINYLSSDGNLKVHINTNAACATQNTARISSVVQLCGCLNPIQYPPTDINVNLGMNTLSTVQWAGDFNVTKGYLHGALCIYSSSIATDYITIRKASDKTILVSNLSPVSLSYEATMGSIEMHINTNASCGTQNTNRTTTMLMEYSMYRGGVSDGYADATFDQGPNPALAMYRGGNDDGFSLARIDQGPNPTLTMYRGGNDDGFSLASIDQGANPALTMYRGGNDDGFSLASIDQGFNPALTMYRGGNDDGFSLASVDQGPNPALTMYRGGVDDGFAIADYEQCDGTMTRWYGSISIDWHNFQNWECGILPTLTSDVIIPSGANLFPTVSANDEIRSINLQPGSTLHILSPAILKINGL